MSSRLIDSGAMVLSMAIILSAPTCSSNQILANYPGNSITMDSLQFISSSNNRYRFKIQKNTRTDALSLFGKQRKLTELEIADYNKMLNNLAKKTGVNIFDLYS